MTPEEHQQLVEQERLGRVLIGVDRAAARRFFTDSYSAAIQAELGEPLFLDRLVVKGSFILGYLLLLLALGASVWAFKWWALLAVPLIIVLWGGYLAGSSRGNAGLGFGIVLLGVAIVVYFLASLPMSVKACLLLVAGAFFFARFTYTSSTFFLRALVVRNWRAFHYLEDKALGVRDVV